MNFSELQLAEPIVRAVTHEGYTLPTPIQAQAIPPIMAGRDVLGCAQTGTGKTAAFALPLIHRLWSSAAAHPGETRPRAVILSPTRELAVQIGESFRAYGRHTHLKHVVVYGGVHQGSQTQALDRGVEVLIATPGRLLDLHEQGYVDFSGTEVFVLDEADRMLDMGFLPDVRRIISEIPAARQTLLFSATMPRDIADLARKILTNPVRIEVAAVAGTAERIQQAVFHVEKRHKPHLLQDLIQREGIERGLVFARTKHGADRIVRILLRAGLRAAAIHGDKTQSMRQRALNNFKAGRVALLVATDIAARGIDVDAVTHVVNYDVPQVAETYVHRIGRTARAGASGVAITFCAPEERVDLTEIERLTRRPLTVRNDHPKYPAIVQGPALDGAEGTGEARKRQRPASSTATRARPKSSRPKASSGKSAERGQPSSGAGRPAVLALAGSVAAPHSQGEQTAGSPKKSAKKSWRKRGRRGSGRKSFA